MQKEAVIAFIISLTLGSSCSPARTQPTMSPLPADSLQATSTASPIPTDTVNPSNTPRPTETSRPTDTPVPTPTDTPRPTSTPYLREFDNIAGEDDRLVGAHYYLWYGPAGRHWREGYKGTPSFGPYHGEYDSADPAVISAHIDLATGHGIDYLLVSWWGPRKAQDGYIDRNLEDHFLANPLIDEVEFAITYESLGRLEEHYEGTEPRIDLSNQSNRETLLSDFDYLERYFQEPQYLRIDGRPVVFLYLSRVYTGDIQGTMQRLREDHDLYLIGDQLYWQSPYDSHQQDLMSTYDGIAAYNIYTAVPEWLDNFEKRVDQKYGEWYEVTRDLGVDLFLNVIPGYDDTAYRFRQPSPVLPRSPERFRSMLDVALRYSDNIIITSANEWHEHTGVFPTADEGLSYLAILGQTLSTR